MMNTDKSGDRLVEEIDEYLRMKDADKGLNQLVEEGRKRVLELGTLAIPEQYSQGLNVIQSDLMEIFSQILVNASSSSRQPTTTLVHQKHSSQDEQQHGGGLGHQQPLESPITQVCNLVCSMCQVTRQPFEQCFQQLLILNQHTLQPIYQPGGQPPMSQLSNVAGQHQQHMGQYTERSVGWFSQLWQPIAQHDAWVSQLEQPQHMGQQSVQLHNQGALVSVNQNLPGRVTIRDYNVESVGGEDFSSGADGFDDKLIAQLSSEQIAPQPFQGPGEAAAGAPMVRSTQQAVQDPGALVNVNQNLPGDATFWEDLGSLSDEVNLSGVHVLDQELVPKPLSEQVAPQALEGLGEAAAGAPFVASTQQEVQDPGEEA